MKKILAQGQTLSRRANQQGGGDSNGPNRNQNRIRHTQLYAAANPENLYERMLSLVPGKK